MVKSGRPYCWARSRTWSGRRGLLPPFLDPFEPQDAEEKLKTISSDVAKADAEAKQAIKQVRSLETACLWAVGHHASRQLHQRHDLDASGRDLTASRRGHDRGAEEAGGGPARQAGRCGAEPAATGESAQEASKKPCFQGS